MANTYNNADLVQAADLMLYVVPASAITGITAATDFTSANTTPIAFSTNASLEVTQDTEDVSHKMACRWNVPYPTNMSWTVSTDALYTKKEGLYSFDSMLAEMVAGDAIGVVLAQTNDGCDGDGTFAIDNTKVAAWGTAVITSLSLSAESAGVAQCSASFNGQGALNNA